MLQTLMQSLRDGVVTTRYPDEPAEVPERFRGAPEPEVGRPFAALPPASVCPTGAIAAGGSADSPAAMAPVGQTDAGGSAANGRPTSGSGAPRKRSGTSAGSSG